MCVCVCVRACACSVIVIVIENGPGESSSNSVRCSLVFISRLCLHPLLPQATSSIIEPTEIVSIIRATGLGEGNIPYPKPEDCWFVRGICGAQFFHYQFTRKYILNKSPRCYYTGSEWTWERWQWRVTLYSLKLQHYWSLTISHTLDNLWESLTSLQSVYSAAPADWIQKENYIYIYIYIYIYSILLSASMISIVWILSDINYDFKKGKRLLFWFSLLNKKSMCIMVLFVYTCGARFGDGVISVFMKYTVFY